MGGGPGDGVGDVPASTTGQPEQAAPDLGPPPDATPQGAQAGGSPTTSPGRPAGEVYDWFRRATDLLSAGDAAAAQQLLEHAVDVEPGSRALREALGRAQYQAGRYADAERTFAWITDRSPDDDYAHFGLGLSLFRSGRPGPAVEHLSMAVAMRPGNADYERALRHARLALRRQEAP